MSKNEIQSLLLNKKNSYLKLSNDIEKKKIKKKTASSYKSTSNTNIINSMNTNNDNINSNDVSSIDDKDENLDSINISNLQDINNSKLNDSYNNTYQSSTPKPLSTPNPSSTPIPTKSSPIPILYNDEDDTLDSSLDFKVYKPSFNSPLNNNHTLDISITNNDIVMDALKNADAILAQYELEVKNTQHKNINELLLNSTPKYNNNRIKNFDNELLVDNNNINELKDSIKSPTKIIKKDKSNINLNSTDSNFEVMKLNSPLNNNLIQANELRNSIKIDSDNLLRSSLSGSLLNSISKTSGMMNASINSAPPNISSAYALRSSLTLPLSKLNLNNNPNINNITNLNKEHNNSPIPHNVSSSITSPTSLVVNSSRKIQAGAADDKYSQIHSFLDNVETPHTTPHTGSIFSSAASTPSLSTPSFNRVQSRTLTDVESHPVPSISRTASNFSQGLTILKNQLKESQAENEKLKLQLEKERSSHSIELKKALKESEVKFEVKMQRNFEFTTNILKDKDELSRKCELMADEIKLQADKFTARAKDREEQFKKELQREKENWEVKEKAFREKWMEKEEKAMKDRTRKILEPEIERLIDENKMALRQAEMEKHEEVKRQREMAISNIQAELYSTRDNLMKEKENALVREREAAQSRYRDQLAQSEQQIMQLRSRHIQELEQERLNGQAELRREKDNREDTLQRQKQLFEERIDKIRNDHSGEVQEFNKRTEMVVATEKQKWKLERETWTAQMRQKLQQELLEKKIEIEKKLNIERDEEIEVVVGRIHDEVQKEKSEFENEHLQKLEKLKKSHSDEIKLLKASNSEYLSKIDALNNSISEWKMRISELENKTIQLQTQYDLSKQKQNQMEELIIKLETSNKEKDNNNKQQLDKEQVQLVRMAGQYEKMLEEERQRSKRAQIEKDQVLEEWEKKRSAEIESIDSRMRAMFAKKDEIIARLNDEILSKQDRIIDLETFMERQQKELFN